MTPTTQLPEGFILNGKKNSYRIESILGHGTFGITYTAAKCNGLKSGQKVAIKEFYIQGISSRDDSGSVSSFSDTISIEQCRKEFVSEAKNLIELNHPNIVKAYEQFEANGTNYYVMDYIDGEDLNSYLKHTDISLKEATDIITKVAYALSYMHESQHMLHLDLKPGNIMRRASDGQIIIIDFGLSGYFTEEGSAEDTSSVGLGTAGYSPMEQSVFRDRTKDFKATIDVYALGGTFYKLITGESPRRATEYAAQPALLTDRLQQLNVPQHTIDIVAKAMSPAPEQRYQSVMEFIYDLNSEERKRRNKGLIMTAIGMAIFFLLVFLGYRACTQSDRDSEGNKEYYESVKDYAFEIYEGDHGNHESETKCYKFFTDGTGLCMHEHYADQDAYGDDGGAAMGGYDETTIETYKFDYTVEGSSIRIPDGLYGGEQSIYIDVNAMSMSVDEDDFSFEVMNVNWNKVRKILGE